MHLDQLEHPEAAVRDVEARANHQPFRAATELLKTTPGVSNVTARVLVSAGKRRSNRTRHGAPWLRVFLSRRL